MNVDSIQRRTLRVLFVTQIIAGVGIAIGASVGALLAADLAGIRVSGLAHSALVVGAALFAVPAASIVQHYGRRPSLATGYFLAAIGALVVVAAAVADSIPFLFAGYFLFGCASAASLQGRYAAVDLAPTALRGRHLSLIVWATTLGAVVGPNLAAVAGAAVDDYGVPTLAGPFVFSALLFVLATLLLVLLLRPDPAVVARDELARSDASSQHRKAGIGVALRVVAARAPARLAIGAMAVAHMAMIGVMAMTPVHIRGAGHDAAHTLRIVGIVISFHIAGMYAFSPVFGWLTDRFGRRPIIYLGVALLLAACAVAGTAGHNATWLVAGLMLLGLGWSASMVAGSTLLTESVAVELRAAAQGLSDLTMGLAGATAGALSGVVVDAWGYPMLAMTAAVTAVVLMTLVSARRALVFGSRS